MFVRMTEEQPVPPAGHAPGHAPGTDPDGTRIRRRSRVFLTAGIALGCVLAIGGTAAGLAYWHLDHRIKGVDINSALGTDRPTTGPTASASSSSSSLAPVATGAMNILVLGSDSRSGSANQKLGGGNSTGARSDTAMVVHINNAHTRATVVSIPRDTLVYRPSCPTSSGGTTAAAYGAMFNSAYSVGGPVCAVKTAEKLTGVRMDHYIEIDFSGFAKLIDSLGGVTVTTTKDINDDKSHLNLKAGTHHLGGTQALAFARTRHGVGDGSDLGRIQLQQQLIKAMLKQVMSINLFTSPTKLYEVADAVTGSLTTDTGLDSLSELMSLGQNLRKIGTKHLTAVTMPVITAPSDPNRVVASEPSATKVWTALRNDTALPKGVVN
jgi:LCP family protein required for cell wall assembly